MRVSLEIICQLSQKWRARRLVTMDGCQDEGCVRALAEHKAHNRPIQNRCAGYTVLWRKCSGRGRRCLDYHRVARGLVAAGQRHDGKESTNHRYKRPFLVHLSYFFDRIHSISAKIRGSCCHSQKKANLGYPFYESRNEKTEFKQQQAYACADIAGQPAVGASRPSIPISVKIRRSSRSAKRGHQVPRTRPVAGLTWSAGFPRVLSRKRSCLQVTSVINIWRPNNCIDIWRIGYMK